MTSTDIAPAEQYRAIPSPARDRPKQLPTVRGKLFNAIELIVFQGMSLDEAAEQAGLTTYALRNAFAKQHVLAHLKARREVLRAAASGKNILRLTEIRDAADNMPAVNAIKLLEELGDDHSQRGSGASASPGVTIRVVTVVQSAPVQTYPSDMSRHDVKQINGLANSDANAASAVDREPSHDGQAIPDSAVRRPPRENP